MSLGTKNRQQQQAEACKHYLRASHRDKLALVDEYIAEFEAGDVSCWSREFFRMTHFGTNFLRRNLLPFGLILAVVTGCATRETVPRLCFSGYTTGIRVKAIRSHGPTNLLRTIGEAPDVPSGTMVVLERVQPLHNKEPRYFIPAAGTLEVVSLERIADYDTKYHSFTGTLSNWKRLLTGELPKQEALALLYEKQLSEIPWMNAARCFHARLRYRTYPWGKAALFLTSYVQGTTGAPVNNDMLVLALQGLSSDGRYAVNGHFEVSHPSLPDSSWDPQMKRKIVFSLDHDSRRAEEWLNGQPDSSFSPTFSQYDEFLARLRIEALGADYRRTR